MGITYSKLLSEYTVVDTVNDRFKINDGSDHEIDLTAGRYRDMVAVAAEIQAQLNTASSGFTVAVNNSTGIITITRTSSWTVDWNTSGYGATLRDGPSSARAAGD